MKQATAKKILHITPHLGGGVGATALNYISSVVGKGLYIHQVVCLDYANMHAKEVAKSAGFLLRDNMSKSKPELLRLIAESDIVLIYWWNHPLLYEFLVHEKLPASRVIMWSQETGYPSPKNFIPKIFNYPDFFVFDTPLSFEAKEVRELSKKQKNNLAVVWSTGGVERIKFIKQKKHAEFIVGYMGTIDFSKIHPDFLELCSRVNIPDVKFIVVGGPNGKELQKEASRLGVGRKFQFPGFVSEKKKWEYLAMFDVLGYPLAPYHYGSCDLALQESMAAGVVPVVLSNKMEKYMVEDGVTGIVAKNKNEYVEALEKLYRDKKLRRRLSKNAKKFALHTYTLKKMNSDWNYIFLKVLKLPKTIKEWEADKNTVDFSPKDIFIESLGEYGADFIAFCNAKNNIERQHAIRNIKKLSSLVNWQSETKSTVHHYHSFFPKDKYLAFWSKLMKTNNPNK